MTSHFFFKLFLYFYIIYILCIYFICIFERSIGQKHSSQQKTNKMTTLEITKIKFEKNISQIEKKDVIIYKMENGFYWLQDFKTGELIDGDRRLYVVKDMAKRWNYNIKKNNK